MNKMLGQYDPVGPPGITPKYYFWESGPSGNLRVVAYLLSGADLDGKVEVDYGLLQTAQLLIS
jgi:hypothetical protein